MAPPKNKEKVVYINIRVPLSRAREIRRAAKQIKAPTVTEFCRELIYKTVEQMKAA